MLMKERKKKDVREGRKKEVVKEKKKHKNSETLKKNPIYSLGNRFGQN